jgi:acetate kinase
VGARTYTAVTSVLVVNAGSSSLKLTVLDDADAIAGALQIDRWDGSADHDELTEFVSRNGNVGVVGHRVVHGGSTFTGPAPIDDSVVAGIEALTDLAPLHQPRALAGIRAVRKLAPGLQNVACFDTAFHAGLPLDAARYALPDDWTRRYGLRRYGFHGLSHAYASRRAAGLAGRELPALRIVTCHLGSGASLAAVQHGRSIDTTMGFTPLEGLVMSTRSGSVDPGLLIWLLQHGNVSLDQLSAGLEQASGLAGVAALDSGTGDMREIRAAADAGHPGARLAIGVYLHRLRREIAAMAAAMNGLDVLVFTGGIGEYHQPIRAAAAEGLGFLGVALDPALNDRATSDAEISDPSASVRAFVVTAREDIEIAGQARSVLGSRR